MPLYEYECATCQKVHEVMQKFADAPLTECPECKGPVAKLISRSSFALKGSGWYTSDYKRAGRKDEAASVAKSSGADATAKPAAAAPTAPAAATPAGPAKSP
jgi:putative FmdB family regulatory protein